MAPDALKQARGPRRVAVIGGGWAGCATAVTLAQAGVAVTLFERAGTLGGRARRVVADATVLDNGQHLLVGAYRRTLELMALVHGQRGAAEQLHRFPLTLYPFGSPRPGDVALSAWRTAAPLHLAGALLTARGLTWRSRWAAIAGFRDLARDGFRCPPGQTVADCFARAPRQVMSALWEPLCLAALNTPPERASAQVFARVLQEAFAGPAANSDFLVPARDLSACFPDAAARFVTERGGNIRCGATVRAIESARDGVIVRTGESADAFDAAVVAVAPHHVRKALGDRTAADPAWQEPLARIDAFSYESITTVYLRFALRLAMRARLLRLDDAPGQWIFCRPPAAHAPPSEAGGHLYAVVISANGPHDSLDHATLAAKVETQLRRLASPLPPVVWSRVIAERRATHACTPGLMRPAPGRIAPPLYLAGDYTDPDLPSTLEAATRSGIAAARAVVDDGPHSRR